MPAATLLLLLLLLGPTVQKTGPLLLLLLGPGWHAVPQEGTSRDPLLGLKQVLM
jgi:hypothetical protein